jgi:integrase/recombinase XerD
VADRPGTGSLIETLTTAELERLLAVARARERLLIGILLDTGLRLGKVADLRVDDVLADGYLRVRGKGDRERLVPLGSVIAVRLAGYLRRGRTRPIGAWVDHVFLARDGRPLTAAAIQHVLRRLGPATATARRSSAGRAGCRPPRRPAARGADRR